MNVVLFVLVRVTEEGSVDVSAPPAAVPDQARSTAIDFPVGRVTGLPSLSTKETV